MLIKLLGIKEKSVTHELNITPTNSIENILLWFQIDSVFELCFDIILILSIGLLCGLGFTLFYKIKLLQHLNNLLENIFQLY